MKKVLEKYRNSDFFEIRYLSLGMVAFFIFLLAANFVITQYVFEQSVNAEYETQVGKIEEVVGVIQDKENLYRSYMNGINSLLSIEGEVNCDTFVEYVSGTKFIENFEELSAVGLHVSKQGALPESLNANLLCIYPDSEVFKGFIGMETFETGESIDAGLAAISSDDVVMTELFTLASQNQGFLMYLYNKDLEGVWTALAIRYKPYFEEVLMDIEGEFVVRGPSSLGSEADFIVYDNSPDSFDGYMTVKERFEMFDKPFEVTVYFKSSSLLLMYFVLFNFVMIFFVILRSYYKLYVDLKIKKLI